MSAPSLLFAAAAMIPAMTAPAEGVLHAASDATLAVGLCNGGSIAIPLGSGAPPATAPCCIAKGCRNGDKRRRIDRKQ